MKKILLFALMAAGSMNAQTVIFEDSFETYTDFAITGIGNWTTVDVDLRPTYGFQGVEFPNSGFAKAFQVFNSLTTTPPLTPSATSDWSAYTGDKAMVCFAAVPNASVSANDDWLISPQIQLAGSGNELSFMAKSCDAQYGLEEFGVYVSTTGTAVADFMPIEEFIINPDDATYYEYIYDLDAYAGEQVYIAIRCTSSDQFGFMVDDFRVTTTALSVPSFFEKNFAVYPNPADHVLNINSKTGVQMEQIQITDLNGRVVRNINAGGITESQIDMSQLATGAYFLKVNTNAGSGVHKIMKK